MKTKKIEIEIDNDLVGLIMMSEKDENNNLILFVNPEFENKTFHYMNSSFSSQVVFERFVVVRVENDFINFVFKNFSQDRIFPTSFVNLSFAQWLDLSDVSHFDSSKISETELNLIEGSFNAFFNSLMCSGLGGNSSTGCQPICSQNSQSSSVISPVCLYLLNISCFRTSINAFPSNLDADLVCNSLGNLIINSSILIDNIENQDYINFLVMKNEI